TAGMSAPTSLTPQLFRSVSSALCEGLLDVAGAVRRRRAALVARPRHITEAEGLARSAGLDEPALPGLAARRRRHERADHGRRAGARQAGASDDVAAPPGHRREGVVETERDAVEVDAHRAPVAVEVELLTDADPGRDAGVEKREVQAAVLVEHRPDCRSVVVE